MNPIQIIVGGSWGSEAKGAIAGYLAVRDNIDIAGAPTTAPPPTAAAFKTERRFTRSHARGEHVRHRRAESCRIVELHRSSSLSPVARGRRNRSCALRLGVDLLGRG